MLGNSDTATHSTVYVPPSPPSSSKRQKEDYVKRPMNAFMLFRSYAYKNGLVSDNHQNNISEMVAKMWKIMPETEKELWRQKAVQVKNEHKQRYPSYRFIPGQKMSERSAMAPRPELLIEEGKTLSRSDEATSRPMATVSATKQPETPVIIVPSRNPIESETTQPKYDDYKMLSNDGVSVGSIANGYHSYPLNPLEQSHSDRTTLPRTPAKNYDPYQLYQSLLLARTDADTTIDHHMVSYNVVAEINATVFSDRLWPAHNIDDTPMDGEEDVDDEEIEKLMKQFIVDL